MQEEIHWLSQKKQYLFDWKNRLANAARDVLPYVDANLEMTEWEIEALINRPTAAGEQPIVNLAQTLRHDYEYIVDAFPPIPNFDLVRSSTANFVTTSGTVNVYGYVSGFRESADPVLREYSRSYTAKYEVLQVAQRRPQSVRALISKFNDQTLLDRFDRASMAYSQAKTGVVGLSQAASEMRNLLYGVNGLLMSMARKTTKDKITWAEMSTRLAKRGPGEGPRYELAGQSAVYERLTNDLSGLSKDRMRSSTKELAQTWTQVLDFVHTVLGLVALEKTEFPDEDD